MLIAITTAYPACSRLQRTPPSYLTWDDVKEAGGVTRNSYLLRSQFQLNIADLQYLMFNASDLSSILSASPIAPLVHAFAALLLHMHSPPQK